MALERDDVVQAAVAILDEYGLADLSMRRVADCLGVKAGALYWHVANKQTLLAAVADEVLDELTPSRSAAIDRALVDWAQDLREVLLRHRDSAELVATALASGLCATDALQPPEDLLRDAGASRDEARWGAAALLHLVLGHVVEEQNAQLMAQLGAGGTNPPETAGFDHAVGALVRGLLAS